MNLKEQFEILRPYNDEEAKYAIERIISNPLFIGIAQYIFEDKPIENVFSEFKNISTIDKFQSFFSDYAVKQTVKKTSTGLTFGGLDNLDKNTPYLFIANHRDIVLDSAIMQILLLENGHKTTQITFGDNLMSNQFIIDLGKMNKMFTFYRSGSRIDQYKNALLHSAYIHHVIKEKKESIWIAQRDGRTKDGNDKTQAGLIKMLIAGQGNIIDSLINLNIVPISTSYEYEPCDIQKVNELYMSKKTNYVKSKGEDLKSVMSGITGFKGRIHVQFAKPLNDFIKKLTSQSINTNEIIDAIVKEIDYQIYINYKLREASYISYDMLNNNNNFINQKYSKIDAEKFGKYMENKISLIEGNKIELQSLFLKIYANPLINFIEATK
ncbi:MAG: hypothetical protein A2X12_04305 [Bacteroidetes bacterium GWE2_29_8]|nr:MAG: hypothetical protein A2X12_04305 [Bacteroidetes bacterium GWE2_29_8]OFY16160.1 MAG: hypothetical protein A2X02_10145 [Bacteroidetes bacterium GWF2_29_10]